MMESDHCQLKKVIITGASGFIGRALTKRLLENGSEVWGICLHPEKLDDLKNHTRLHIIQAEFQDYQNLSEKIKETGFDAFFHFAWQGSNKNRDNCSIQIPNISYSSDAAYAAAECKCKKFIFADSSYEFLKSTDETGCSRLCSVYGIAKNAARQMCQVIAHNNRMAFCGVLFTNVFGVGDMSSRSTNTMLRRLMEGSHLDLTGGNELYDWTYIDDCAGGIIAAAQLGQADKIYYVGSRHLRPLREIAAEARDIVAPGAELRFGAYPDHSFVDYSEIDTYGLYRDTGYLPTSDFKESIQKTVKWLKEGSL